MEAHLKQNIKIRQNYLRLQNNCKVLQSSSEMLNGQAWHILTSNQKQVWVTENAPPQHLIIDVEELLNKPDIFNYIGFYCWYDYQTNPALVEVSVKGELANNYGHTRANKTLTCDNSTNDGDWVTIAKIRLQKVTHPQIQKEGWQQFKINPIQAKRVKFLKVTILENFGDSNTYLNQISLGYVNPNQQHNFEINSHSLTNPREKTISEMTKLTSTQKQLRKANQKLRNLELQNTQMKDAIFSQNQIIVKMQVNMDKLVDHIHRLEQKQAAHSQAIKGLMGGKKNVYYDAVNEEETGNRFKKIQYSYQNQNIQKNSNAKVRDVPKEVQRQYLREPFAKKSKGTILRGGRQDSVDNDTSSLSQYSRSPKGKNNYISMLEKLQTLCAIRDEKKKQLRSNKKSKHHPNSYDKNSDASF